MKFLPITLKSTIFFYFVWKVHEATECIKPECEIACFIILLKEVLFNLNKDDKTYQKKKKKTFIVQCVKYLSVFGSMVKLIENNESIQSVVRALKAINEDKNKKRFECLINKKKNIEAETDFLLKSNDN